MQTSQSVSYWITSVFEFIYSNLMVITPFLAYIPQYLLMKRNKCTGSFSKLVCYFLLLANISKIVFFFGEYYRFVIFLQALVISILQVYLLDIFYKINVATNQCYKNRFNKQTYNIKDGITFKILANLFALMFTQMAIFAYSNNIIITQVTGSISGFFEGIVAVPQCINNYRSKSVKSLRQVNKSHNGHSLVRRRRA